MSKYSSINEFVQGEDPELLVGATEVRAPVTTEAPDVSFADAWESSMELDSTHRALGRFVSEKQYTEDPDYNLEDFDELMTDVPLEAQPLLQQNLLSARSAEHAQYMKQRTMKELEEQARIAGYGAKGMATRVAVNLLDPGAWLLSIAAAPIGAGTRATRLAAAIKVGFAAGVENALLEEALLASSQTRTQLDVAYAFGAGAVLGGGIGALLGKNAGKTRPDSDTVPGRMNEDMVTLGDQHMKRLDAAVIDIIHGKEPAKPKINRTMESDIQARMDAHLGELEAQRVRDGRVTESDLPPLPPRPKDTLLEAKATRKAEVDAEVQALKAEPTPKAPETPKVSGAVAKMRKALEKYDDAMAKLAAGGKGIKANIEMEVNKAKRAFIAEMKGDRHGADVVGENFIGVNPKLSEFREVLDKQFGKLAAKTETKHARAVEAYDLTLKQRDEKVNLLIAESDALKADLESTSLKHAGAAEAVDEVKAPDLTRYKYSAVEEEAFLKSLPNQQFKNARWSMSAQLARSPNPMSKFLGNTLMENAVGMKNGALNRASAETEAGFVFDTAMQMFDHSIRENFHKWLKHKGIKWHNGQLDPDVFEEYMTEIGTAQRTGKKVHKSVAAPRAALRDAYQFLADNASDAEVRGFAGKVFDSEDYLQRVPDVKKWKAAYDDLESIELGAGPPLEEAIFRGLRKASPEWDDLKQIRRVAKAYAAGPMKRHVGQGGTLPDIRIDDLDNLREMMIDMEINADDIGDVIMMLEKAKEKPGLHIPARAKKRLLMDLDIQMEVINSATGGRQMFDLSSVFDHNAGRLLQQYAKSVGGLTGIARASKDTPFPMRSRADYEYMKGLARSREIHAPQRQHLPGGVSHNIETEFEILDGAFNHIVGNPNYDPTNGTMRLARTVNSFNYLADMGMVFTAQIAETGSVMASAGIRTLLRSIPSIPKIIKGLDGRASTDLGMVVERELALGNQLDSGRAFFKGMETEATTRVQAETKMQHYLYKGSRVVGKANSWVMGVQQRAMAGTMMQDFYDASLRGGKTKMSKRRLSSIGITEADAAKVADQMKQHATVKKGSFMGKDNLLNPNFEKWDDQDLARTFRVGVRRRVQRGIQENDFGNSTWSMQSKAWGKMLFQFKSFVMSAWEKGLLHNVAAADLESLRYVFYTTLMASVGTGAQLKIKAFGDEKKTRDLDKQFELENFIKMSVARTAYASVAPVIIDTLYQGFTDDPYFSPYRSSGLASGFLDFEATPTGRRGKALVDLATGLPRAAFQDDYRLSMEQWRAARALVPFQTMPGMYNALNVIGDKLGKRLPKKSQRQR